VARIGAIEQLFPGRRRGQNEARRPFEDALDLLAVAHVGNDHLHRVAVEADRDSVITQGVGTEEEAGGVGAGFEMLGAFDELDPVLFGQGLVELFLADQALVEQDLAQ